MSQEGLTSAVESIQEDQEADPVSPSTFMLRGAINAVCKGAKKVVQGRQSVNILSALVKNHRDNPVEEVFPVAKASPHQEYAKREITKIKTLLGDGANWCDMQEEMTGAVLQVFGDDTPERQNLLKCLEDASASYKLINDRLAAMRKSNADATGELQLLTNMIGESRRSEARVSIGGSSSALVLQDVLEVESIIRDFRKKKVELQANFRSACAAKRLHSKAQLRMSISRHRTGPLINELKSEDQEMAAEYTREVDEWLSRELEEVICNVEAPSANPDNPKPEFPNHARNSIQQGTGLAASIQEVYEPAKINCPIETGTCNLSDNMFSLEEETSHYCSSPAPPADLLPPPAASMSSPRVLPEEPAAGTDPRASPHSPCDTEHEMPLSLLPEEVTKSPPESPCRSMCELDLPEDSVVKNPSVDSLEQDECLDEDSEDDLAEICALVTPMASAPMPGPKVQTVAAPILLKRESLPWAPTVSTTIVAVPSPIPALPRDASRPWVSPVAQNPMEAVHANLTVKSPIVASRTLFGIEAVIADRRRRDLARHIGPTFQLHGVFPPVEDVPVLNTSHLSSQPKKMQQSRTRPFNTRWEHLRGSGNEAADILGGRTLSNGGDSGPLKRWLPRTVSTSSLTPRERDKVNTKENLHDPLWRMKLLTVNDSIA